VTLIAMRPAHARSPMPAIRTDRAVEAPYLAPAIHGSNNGRNGRYPVASACTRILIAGGHEVVRAGLRSILECHDGWQVIAEASDGKEAISKAVTMKPDVAIIDCSFPAMNAIETTCQIRARTPQTEVLAMTIHENDDVVCELLQAGARAFVLASDGTKQIAAAIRSLAAHRPFFTANLSAMLIDTFLSGSAHRAGNALTPRERVVVQLIAEGRSNKEIGCILNRSQKTVEAQRAAAMRKVGVTSTAGLVRYAVRNKLIEA
jgi:DNA-binding NarL/FixJ family response regulator